MKTSKFLAPVESGPSGGNPSAPVAKSTTTRTVPKKDHDFGQLCTNVANKWQSMPTFVLLHSTQSAFAAMAASYNSNLGVRNSTSGKRPALTGQLDAADKQIDKGIGKLKLYLKDKYEENATAYYAAFGIEYKRNAYRFPDDREKRLATLKQVIASVEAEGFADKAYGKEFWTELEGRYEQLLSSAKGSDGTVSIKTSGKNKLKQDLAVVLNSLIFLIKANYPDTWRAELRSWGFQKEKY